MLFMISAAAVGATSKFEEPNLSSSSATDSVESHVGLVQGEPRFVELPDRLSSVVDRLSAEAPVHYYGFVAKRGQNVLLATPGEKNPEKQSWRIEYYHAEKWQTLTFEKQVFEGLEAGSQVIVRIVPAVPTVVPEQPYKIVFGSYPVLVKYDLHDEPGLVRIPGGRTIPGWLATQAYKETRLEVEFKDAKGTPLEGAAALLYIEFKNKDVAKIVRQFFSDKDGKISQVINLGQCYGGLQADEFVDKNRGFNTWSSRYEPGAYFVGNALLGTPEKNPHTFYIGHICSQRLIKTIPPKN